MKATWTVNGKLRAVEAPDDMPLLWRAGASAGRARDLQRHLRRDGPAHPSLPLARHGFTWA